MENYKRLTKTIKNKLGEPVVVCRHFGTEECQNIHSSCDCQNCPMIHIFLQQLKVFEDIYEEAINDESNV